MFTVSDAFTAATTRSHKMATKLEVLRDGYVIDTIVNDADSEPDVGIVDGSVSLDATAQTFASGRVTIADRTGTLLPLLPTDELRPTGNELRVWRGIDLSGTVEWVPLCTGPMFAARVSEEGAGYAIEVDFYDRAKSLSLYSWSTTYPIASGTNNGTALLALLADRFPAAVYATMTPAFEACAATTPTLMLGGSGNTDPAGDAVKLAESAGRFFKFDRLGNPTLSSVADPTFADAVAEITEGVNLLGVSAEWTADGGYNGVVVYGQAPDSGTPVYAEVWDTDPSSETYYLGSYGKRPKVINDSAITASDAASARATAEFYRHAGVVRNVSFTMLPNPALDPLDVIYLQRDRLGIGERFVVESLEVPLVADGAMRVICRSS